MPEWTLLNIKPDAVERNLIGEIIRRVEAKGFKIIALDKVQLEREEAEAFAESINAPYMETSALTGDNVDDVFLRIGRLVISHAAEIEEEMGE